MNNPQSSAVFQSLIKSIMDAARSPDNLCIIGEVGTGKRQAAVSVHKAAGLDEGRFSVVNCMALSHQEFLSDLFGRVTEDGDLVRKGAVALAEGGTLYLHEVHELSRESQAALVRFLETKSYRPVGSGMNLTANVRIIVSSSATLEALVELGKFRQDLQHFLTPLIIHMPRLNDRIEDIPTLFKSLVFQVSKGVNVSFDDEALLRLKAHSYTGNLLELRNLALRAIASMQNGRITLEDIEGAIRGTAYFDLADQRLISPFNDLAEQAGDEQYKAIRSVTSPKMLGHQSTPAEEANSTPPGTQEFADLNRHMPMTEISGGSQGVADADVKQVTEAPAAASPKQVLETPTTRRDLKAVERQYFLDLLDQFSGDKAEVAKTAGLNLRTLYRRLKALDIE